MLFNAAVSLLYQSIYYVWMFQHKKHLMNKAYQWSTEHNIIRDPNIPSDTPCCIRWSKMHFTRKGDEFWEYVLIIYLISLGCLFNSHFNSKC